MTLSKFKDILKERRKSAVNKLDIAVNDFYDEEHGELDTNKLVQRGLVWNFGSIVHNQSLKEVYDHLLFVLNDNDWTTTGEDELTFGQWVKHQRDKYCRLAMQRDKRSSSASANLVQSYEREACKEVYELFDGIVTHTDEFVVD